MENDSTHYIKLVSCILLLCTTLATQARRQEEQLPAVMENYLENEAADAPLLEDDAQWQQLNSLKRHKIPLNTADETMLQSLGFLTPLQISNFLHYRFLLGKLVSIYELQAVPGFQPDIIQRILPYVFIENGLDPHYNLFDYLHKGEHTLLLRYGQLLEKAKGYLHTDSTLPYYRGSPQKMFMRYRYNFSHYLSWGITMEKDAGEPFYITVPKQGFDFYSAHIFFKTYKKLKKLVVGDYTVNLGQGLITWQSQGYGKSAAVMQVKREGEILRPYTSAGEFYFYRGAAVTLQQQAWQLTAFASCRKLDGNSDTLNEITAASIISSGYHRTNTEIAKRGAIQLLSTGGNIRYEMRSWQLGGNIIYHHFSPVVQKIKMPYNQFDFNGAQLAAASIDYAGSWRNVYLFGEVAICHDNKFAVVQGLLATMAPAVDMSIVYRYYDRAYHSMFAKGFGDGSRTINENGVYSGWTVRLNHYFKLDAYADIFHFPWLKYRINAPSSGQDFFLQGTYTPHKKLMVLLRYNYRHNHENTLLPGNPIKVILPVALSHLRLQWDFHTNKKLNYKTRLEYSRYKTAEGSQEGWMCYLDVNYRFEHLPLTFNTRIARFQTSSYDTRIYAFENSVLYDMAVSQFYGSGWQYYTNIKWKVMKQLHCWARIHQTLYPGRKGIGSGADAIAENKKTMLQFQLLQTF